MLYDNNPTLENFSLKETTLHDEQRQGEVFLKPETLKLGFNKFFYVESYGCAMNFSDTEIVASILDSNGFQPTRNLNSADLILINTCSIREKAEDTVRKRLKSFDQEKKKGALIGVLGCMAERLKSKFLEQEHLVDFVIGPDAYRDLPRLIENATEGEKGVNVLLSREETYADITPVRLDANGVTAFISIMRGCDNMCSFCVVPFTRGRERSRDAFSIVSEAHDLFNKGYREVTLLGQNVDSYKWLQTDTNEMWSFAKLLQAVAEVDLKLRIRFSTSHPKDITDDVLHIMAANENICKYIHLPVQSGNSRILSLMNRTYDADWYKKLIIRLYKIMPNCAVSTDIISGFCSETDEDHNDTLEMMQFANYSYAYMYTYSERPGTPAAKKLVDDVPDDIKNKRLSEIIALQRELSYQHNLLNVGKTYEVLIEGTSKKSDQDFKARTSQNKVVVFKKVPHLKIGDYCDVFVDSANSATLFGTLKTPQVFKTYEV